MSSELSEIRNILRTIDYRLQSIEKSVSIIRGALVETQPEIEAIFREIDEQFNKEMADLLPSEELPSDEQQPQHRPAQSDSTL